MPLVEKHYRRIFFASIYFSYLFVLFDEAGLQDLGDWLKDTLRLVLPLIELGFFHAIGTLCLASLRTRTSRAIEVVYLGTPLVVYAIYIAQMNVLQLTGNFITASAFQSSADNHMIVGTSFYGLLTWALGWWIFFAACYARAAQRPAGEQDTLRTSLISAQTIALTLGAAYLLQLSAGFTQSRNGMLAADYRQTPVATLTVKYYRALKYRYAKPGDNGIKRLAVAPYRNQRYPLEKTTVYEGPLPYPATGVVNAKKNVIVIFTEGTSARLLNIYGSRFQNLTPNMDRLASSGTQVVNYYNHTAATYRGIQGQLVSGYPATGGSGDAASLASGEYKAVLARTNFASVPSILAIAGYDTAFISAHHDDEPLNTLIRSLHFDKVYTAETVAADLPANAVHMTADSLSDATLFRELRHVLEQREKNRDSKPFFIGTYNFGTHAFLDVDDAGIKYSDGASTVLNRLHNYDNELGKFLDYFYSSDFAKNTIIVLTSDHPNFPEPPYRKLAGANFQPYFVDRVPLLIYDPFTKLPPFFDARGRTSLDLAPTILQLIGVQEADNSFIGTSLFEHREDSFGFSSFGNASFATDSNGVYFENAVPSRYADRFAEYQQMLQNYHRLEAENRIFPDHL